VSDSARVFFGGEVLALDALRRHRLDAGTYDVAIGPVNGVRLFGRPLTVTAAEMLEATRILGAPTLVPVHDEHRAIPGIVAIGSSIRDLDLIDHDDVRVVELGFGERFVATG